VPLATLSNRTAYGAGPPIRRPCRIEQHGPLSAQNRGRRERDMYGTTLGEKISVCIASSLLIGALLLAPLIAYGLIV
jgi:hypothetical protein